MKKLVVLKPFGGYGVGEILECNLQVSNYFTIYHIQTLIHLGYVKWQEEEDELADVLRTVYYGDRINSYSFKDEATAVRKFFREKLAELKENNPYYSMRDVLKLFEESE